MQTRRRALALALAAGIALASAAPASAHVTVNPREAAKGSFAKLTFRVPTERDDASTTQVEVAFPTEHAIANVSFKPHAGWTTEVTRSGATVSRIIWKAESAASAIAPGQFDEFDVSVGPLPDDVDALVFKALQTYSDGQVVRWIDEPDAGDEPEHPAPVLTLTAETTATTAAAASDGDEAAPGDDADADDDEDGGAATDGMARLMGAVGIVLGVLGLGAGIANGRRRRDVEPRA